MELTDLRDRLRRSERLDEEWLHLFALPPMAKLLREEPEYQRNGRTGLTLLKSEHLRVVLEVARAGTEIGDHRISGPTLVHVLEGSLALVSDDATRVAHAAEMVVVPHDRPRRIHAESDAVFLWALSLDA